MRKLLLPSVLSSVVLALAGCADHDGTPRVATDGPPPPINQPDTGVVGPTNPASGAAQGGNEGGSGGGPGGGGSGGNHTGEGGNPGGHGGNGGGSGGQPVPEPGTLLLVGTGLAGAALLRRRQQRAKSAGADRG